MKPDQRARKWIAKKAKLGVRSFPVGTIAFYGPDNLRATKVAVGIIPAPQSETTALRRWFVETGDVRKSDTIFAEIAAFLRGHGVHSVAMADGILGCPHEEGIDYPEGSTCPDCPYWAGRDRWTGQLGKN
ncbi:MAG: hypothetical protein E5X67_15625 [Mesorhizobium sp.]|uniref:hypothetical protein n=1 Tax=Mesorhizobium sp. TaxID=1871066 RepID=UPI0011F8332B|nr:hypothetical protein [Mesorhizobium sp.]TIP27470.1 MAG: hypothetical protein E5X67_15625 [Mesorhizobium sp.]